MIRWLLSMHDGIYQNAIEEDLFSNRDWGAAVRYFSFALMTCLGCFNAFAVDHIDGHEVIKDAKTDITDLYVFPTEGGKSLAVVLNVHPFVTPDVRFPSEIGYDIIIRKADIRTENGQTGFATSADDELRITCHFDDQDAPAEQSITCATQDGTMAVTTGVDQVSVDGDFKLFSGNRSDPFFFDGEWTLAVSCGLTGGKVPPATGANSMSFLNVRSIVLEIDRTKLFGGAFDLLAVAAQTYERSVDGKIVARHDRVGRPEITNVSLIDSPAADKLIYPSDAGDLRGSYNLDDPFNVSTDHAISYHERLKRNIKFYDSLGGGKDDWDAVGLESFIEVLLDDFLVVDPGKQCGNENFLEIERAMLAGQPHKTCGGRLLKNDVMDTLLSVYIHNDNPAASGFLGDGANKPFAFVSKEFPYLAQPFTAAQPPIEIDDRPVPLYLAFALGAAKKSKEAVNCPSLPAK